MHRIKGNILVTVTAARLALQRRCRKLRTELYGIFVVLELAIIGIFGETRLVRQELRQCYPRLCAAGKSERGRPTVEWCVEIKPALFRQFCGQRTRHAF